VTGVTGTRTHHRRTATGVKHVVDATQGAPDVTVGLGALLLDVMAIKTETRIGTAESEMVRQPNFLPSFWLIELTKYDVCR
jgi:hypothetical protein